MSTGNPWRQEAERLYDRARDLIIEGEEFAAKMVVEVIRLRSGGVLPWAGVPSFLDRLAEQYAAVRALESDLGIKMPTGVRLRLDQMASAPVTEEHEP